MRILFSLFIFTFFAHMAFPYSCRPHEEGGGRVIALFEIKNNKAVLIEQKGGRIFKTGIKYTLTQKTCPAAPQFSPMDIKGRYMVISRLHVEATPIKDNRVILSDARSSCCLRDEWQFFDNLKQAQKTFSK